MSDLSCRAIHGRRQAERRLMRLHNHNAPASPSLESKGDEGAVTEELTMAGNKHSGRPKGARAYRDEAVLELLDQLGELRSMAVALNEIKRLIAHIERRRVAAIGHLREAQNMESDAAIPAAVAA